METNGKVEWQINDSIGYITFHHPKGNSLPGSLLDQLSNKIKEFSMDDQVKVILLQSEGAKAFCAGASFDELINIKDYESGRTFFMGFANVMLAMIRSPKFIVARVQGKTVGGGVGLVAASDYAFAVTSAQIKLSELALGIGPFVIEPLVERKIGNSNFAELTINYDWHSAEWAYSKGLYKQLYHNIPSMDSEIGSLMKTLKASNPRAMAELKKVFWKDTRNWDELMRERAELSGKLVLSDYTKQYIEAFKKNKK